MAAGVVVLAVLTLTGCDDTVEVDRFPVTTAGQQDCREFLKALPGKVSDQPARATSGSAYAAAYGDPAIVVRCGVGRPKGFDRFSFCHTANGIDWFIPDTEGVTSDQSRDVLMTTVGRSPAIEVSLPAKYRPPVAAMVDLERAIRRHTSKTGGCV